MSKHRRTHARTGLTGGYRPTIEDYNHKRRYDYPVPASATTGTGSAVKELVKRLNKEVASTSDEAVR